MYRSTFPDPFKNIPTLSYGCCNTYPINDYMLEQLNKHVKSIEVRNQSSDIQDYRGYGYIQQPSYIYYKLNNTEEEYCIDFDCHLGEIRDRWGAPLFLRNVSHRTPTKFLHSILVFVYDDSDTCRQGKVSCPHVVIDYDGNFVRSYGLSKKQEHEIKELLIINSEKDHESETDETPFFQRFLEKCPMEVRIRYILSYIPSLHIRSGK